MPDSPNPLIDLIELMKEAMDNGKIPQIDPKKYGFTNPDDYWRRIRELAGVPPATDPAAGGPTHAEWVGEPKKKKPAPFGFDMKEAKKKKRD